MSQIEIILRQKNSTGSHQHTEFMAIYSINCSTCIESEKFYIPLQKIT